jgi:hypothetical protein
MEANMKMASVMQVAQEKVAQDAVEPGIRAPDRAAIVLKLVAAENPLPAAATEQNLDFVAQAEAARRVYLRGLIIGAVAAVRNWLARRELGKFESWLDHSQSMAELESRMRQLGVTRWP